MVNTDWGEGGGGGWVRAICVLLGGSTVTRETGSPVPYGNIPHFVGESDPFEK